MTNLVHREAASGVLRDRHFVRNPVTGLNERAFLVEPALSSLVQRSIPSLPADARPSVTRADTATEVDSDRVIQTIASGELRNQHYVDANDGATYRTTLLERASQNEFTQSEDLTHGDWTAVALSARNADQATGPDGVLSLDELVEDSTVNGFHYIYQTPTLTADATYSISCWAVANTRSWVYLLLNESGGYANRVRAHFDLASGAVGATAAFGAAGFVRAHMEDYTDLVAGLYRCVLVGSVGNGATNVVGRIALANADGSENYTGDGSSSLYAGFAQLEDDTAVASSYIPTTTAADPRAADDFTVSLLDTTPQEATYLYEGVVLDLPVNGESRKVIWNVGGSATSRLEVAHFYNTQERLYVRFHNGTTDEVGWWNVTLSLYDHISVRVYQASNGAITAGLSVNGGAEDTTMDSAVATQALPGSWANNVLRLSSDTAGGRDCNTATLSFKAQSGSEKTLAQMQALTGADIAYYSTYAAAERPSISDAGAPIGEAKADVVTATSEGITLPYDSGLGSTVLKLTTGASGSQTRAYRFGGNLALNGFTANQAAAMLVGVYIPASSEVGFADVTLHAVDDQGSTTGTSAAADGEWQWLWVDRTWDASATAAYFELRFADSVNLSGTDEVLYLALPTAVDAKGVGAPIDNTTDSATSATTADTVYETRSSTALVESTGYLRFLEVGTAKAGGTVLHFGSGTAGADPRLVLDADGGYYGLTLDDGTDVVTSRLTTAPAAGELCELRYEILSTGAVRIHQSIDAATETSATASSAPTAGLPSALAGDRIYYGSEAGTDFAAIPVILHARFSGSVTLAECRAFAGV